MPDRHIFQHAALRVFHRWPLVQRLAMGILNAFYQLALLPFRRSHVGGASREQADLVARTDSYNAAAERYFATFANPEFLLDKPFSETHLTAKHLIDAGVLIDAMRLTPGDTVVEIGAGSCWLSHMLNRYGCRTISLDVSPTAMALGKTLFERDPRTHWRLDPRFLTYDGRSIPLPSSSCDRIVINDAFHHIPNQRELLTEMHRILTGDGAIAMAEPGRGHGSAEQAVHESTSTGVLEHELALDDLAALARDCGFERVTIVAASPLARREIPARELGAFMGGCGFAHYWKEFCSALEQHHYIVCYKGSPDATTARPGRLSARLRVAGGTHLRIRQQQSATVTLCITNTGDTRWLQSEQPGKGWTRIGAHLYRDGEPRELVEFNWFRAELPKTVPPGSQMTAVLTLPAIATPGRYLVVLDLVVEGMTWFADRGSGVAAVTIDVSPSH
jgi:SAM-dependent methyltransferase